MSWQQPWLTLFLEMILAMLFGCSRKEVPWLEAQMKDRLATTTLRVLCMQLSEHTRVLSVPIGH
jgi:hypothetical protein